MSISFNKFIQASCILMGGFTGALISLPLAASVASMPPIAVVIGFCGLGMLIGYRRRNSHIFFYFSLICVLILSTLISFYALGPAPVASPSL